MRLTKKCVILLILLNILFITGTYASSSSLILNSNSSVNANINTSSDSVMLNNNSNVNGSANISSNVVNNSSSNTTSDVIINPNPDNNTIVIRKDYIQEYLSSIVKERDNVEMYMNKIDGKELFNAICKQQKFIDGKKDEIAKMTISLVDWDISNPEERTVAEVTFDLEKQEKVVTVKNNVYMHTGMSMGCFFKEKDKVLENNGNVAENEAVNPNIPGDEFGFNMGEIKIALKGDLSGKAEIDVVDLSLMQQELVEEINLEDAFLVAADMDTSYEIDVIDLSMLQDYIVNN